MSPDPLTGDDPAVLAAAFHRVADRLDDMAARERRRGWQLAAGAVALAVLASLVAWVIVLTLQDGSQAAEIKSNQAAIAADTAARRHEAVAEEAKLCASFSQLAALQPPAAGPSGPTPSRTFLDRQHVILVGIGTEIGCKPSGHS